MQSANGLLIGVGALVGLVIGSFLNVVIHRWPRMLYRGWLRDATDNLHPADPAQGLPQSLWDLVMGGKNPPPQHLHESAVAASKQLDALPPLSLARPRSRCGHCGHVIRWHENIPVLSFLALRGRCSECGQSIGWRYPVVELITSAFFALCANRWGLSLEAAAWAAFAALLICQFAIDLDTQLLPDDLNYLLLWLGLLASAIDLTVPLQSAVWGAALGYLILWTFFHVFRLLTGKEGMGYGDFKLMAALGAWLGSHYLLAILLMSSIVGALMGGLMLLIGKLAHRDMPMAFGPYLAGAGLLCLIVGPNELQDLIPFAFPTLAGR